MSGFAKDPWQGLKGMPLGEQTFDNDYGREFKANFSRSYEDPGSVFKSPTDIYKNPEESMSIDPTGSLREMTRGIKKATGVDDPVEPPAVEQTEEAPEVSKEEVRGTLLRRMRKRSTRGKTVVAGRIKEPLAPTVGRKTLLGG